MIKEKAKTAAESELDDALEHTFPASDPISLGEDSGGEGARIDRQPAALDVQLVEKLSKQVKDKATSAAK